MAVTEDAINRIKEMIVSGELRPGDRLPKEADLAERLGLSRNSLREAVSALSLMNILNVRRGDGTYVTSLEPQLLLETLSFVVDFHRDDTVLHFFEVRRILEPAAASMAAQHMSADDTTELAGILDAIDADADLEALVANDLRFHRRIAEGAGNPVLTSLLDTLSAPTTRARVWRGLTQKGAVERTRQQHVAIYEAIAARQPDVARAWATVHIADVEHWLRTVL